MSSSLPPSSHSAGDEQPVNPYAASSIPEPSQDSYAGGGESPPRDYRLKLTWADRASFLRSVGPARVIAVAGGVIWVQNAYDLLLAWSHHISTYGLTSLNDWVTLSMAVVFIAVFLAGVYGSYLTWRYADALREAVGGAAASVGAWSRLHYQTAWLGAAIVLTQLGSELLQWLLEQTVLR